MEEKRKFLRFTAVLDAKYFAAGNSRGKDCKVTELSREGTRIEFYTREKIGTGSTVRLDIEIPRRTEPVTTSVALLWSKDLYGDTQYSFAAGGRLTMIEPEDKWDLLDYAYKIWTPVCEDECLQTVNRPLTRQWHPDRNGNLTPRDVSVKSQKMVWWICGKGHAWQARVCDRCDGRGCPDCG